VAGRQSFERAVAALLFMPKKKLIIDDDDPPDIESQEIQINVSRIQDRVKSLLKMSTFEPEYKYWLDTGSEHLNATLGSRIQGLPYGKIYELAGQKHGGKTAIASILAGMAQKEGAGVGWIDLENSYDPEWVTKLGLNATNVVPIVPKFIFEDKKSEVPILESTELLFAEAEETMRLFMDAGCKKQIWILDSIANIQTRMAIAAGATDRNMRVKLDRAAFLSESLPRWAGYAVNYNAMVLMINQERKKPNVMFGDPTYTPGGEAVSFNAAVQARISRISKGMMLHNGKSIGIVGKIVNKKNKAGGGSVQNETCAFKIQWNCNPAKIRFMTVEQAEKEMKGD
jgi:RecA/RadA recombinase